MADLKKYRKMQNNLDKAGVVTAIVKEGKFYLYYVDFQLVKSFRKRQSANNRLIKLFKTIYP